MVSLVKSVVCGLRMVVYCLMEVSGLLGLVGQIGLVILCGLGQPVVGSDHSKS